MPASLDGADRRVLSGSERFLGVFLLPVYWVSTGSQESLRRGSAPSQVRIRVADTPDVTEHGSRVALVIDDSRAMRGILKRILEPLGFSVREATNGREALDLIWNEDLNAEVALIDWNMPV